jgi:hypothetical protein
VVIRATKVRGDVKASVSDAVSPGLLRSGGVFVRSDEFFRKRSPSWYPGPVLSSLGCWASLWLEGRSLVLIVPIVLIVVIGVWPWAPICLGARRFR